MWKITDITHHLVEGAKIKEMDINFSSPGDPKVWIKIANLIILETIVFRHIKKVSCKSHG